MLATGCDAEARIMVLPHPSVHFHKAISVVETMIEPTRKYIVDYVGVDFHEIQPIL
jgi:hypothetical protein